MRAFEEFTRKNYWFALFVLISCLKLFYSPLATEDLFVWVASGLKMIDLGHVISKDYFTIHQNLEFIYPSQLTNLFYGLIFKVGGSNLLFFILRMTGILFVIFIYRKYLINVEKNFWNLLLALLLVFVVFYMLDRPQYLAFFPAMITFSFLEKSHLNFKLKAIFLGLIVLWSNVHSSVLILLPILISQLLAQIYFKNYVSVKETIQKIILVIVGICSTPINIKIFKYAFATVVLSNRRFASEWSGLFSYHDFLFVLIILFFVVHLLFTIFKNQKIKDYFLTGYYVLPIMTIFNIRFSIFFCLTNFILFNRINLWKSGLNIFKNSAATFIVSFLLILLSLGLFLNWKENHFLDENYDAKMISFLQTEKKLKVYHEVDGGMLSAFLYSSDNKYFIDARNIIFSDETFRDYVLLKSNKSLSELIKKYDFDTFIIKKKNEVMLKNLLDLKWEKKFEGDRTILLKKRA